MSYVHMDYPWSNPPNTSFSPTIVNVSLTHECKEELRAIVREELHTLFGGLATLLGIAVTGDPGEEGPKEQKESEPHA